MKKFKVFIFLLAGVAFMTTESCKKDTDGEDMPVITEDVSLSSDKVIASFMLSENEGVITETEKTITLTIDDSDVTSLAPEISISENATISPSSGEALDFTNPVKYTVTAEDGSTVAYVVTVLSTSCDAISNFLPNEKYEALEALLSSADTSSWIIKKFTINGESVEGKYSEDRVEFDFSTEKKLGYIRDFNALGLTQAFSSFTTFTTEDDEQVLLRGEDGNLKFTFNFVDLYDISSDSPPVYKDFTNRTYQVVKDANSDKVELRSCEDSVVLILEKAPTLDFCEPEGDFVSFDELAETKFLIGNEFDNDSNSFTEPWVVKTFTIGDEEVTTAYDDISFAFDRGGSVVYISEPVGAAGSITYTIGENNELRVALRINFEGRNDFDARFYRVVKGATETSFELRSCTWNDQKPVVIVFEKL